MAIMENPPKNGLAAATVQKPDVKDKIVEFEWWMLKQGYNEGTAQNRAYTLLTDLLF